MSGSLASMNPILAETVLPSWIPRSLGEFRELVIEIVAVWIVGAILDVIGMIGEAILTAGEELVGVLLSLGEFVRLPFSIVAGILLGLISTIDSVFIGLTSSLGPLAPIGFALSFGTVLILGFVTARIVIEVIRFL